MDDEYYYPRINPERRRRFFKYLAVEWKLHSKKKSEQYRKQFVGRIEKLRGIKTIGELRKEEKLKPVIKTPAEIEQKIRRVAQKEEQDISQIDLKEELNRSKIEELTERVKEMQQTIKKLSKKKSKKSKIKTKKKSKKKS
jgi:hypothetical protein